MSFSTVHQPTFFLSIQLLRSDHFDKALNKSEHSNMTSLISLKLGPGSGFKSKLGQAKNIYSWKIRIANCPPWPLRFGVFLFKIGMHVETVQIEFFATEIKISIHISSFKKVLPKYENWQKSFLILLTESWFFWTFFALY